MFRNDLRRRVSNIFGVKDVTFDAYSDSFEQEKIFIEIDACRPRVSSKDGGLETARVVGQLVIFSQGNKLPFGFFIKKIEQASAEDKRPLFFYDIDQDLPDSPARLQNIHERRCSFVFLYESQYDPEKGSLTSVNFECEES